MKAFAVEYEIPGRGSFILASSRRGCLIRHARRLGLDPPLVKNIVPITIEHGHKRETKSRQKQ
jgi:hypothetical protein